MSDKPQRAYVTADAFAATEAKHVSASADRIVAKLQEAMKAEFELAAARDVRPYELANLVLCCALRAAQGSGAVLIRAVHDLGVDVPKYENQLKYDELGLMCASLLSRWADERDLSAFDNVVKVALYELQHRDNFSTLARARNAAK